MVSKCANPECAARFRYLHEGKLFQVDTSAEKPALGGPHLLSSSKPGHHIEHFWLCGDCSATLTLVVEPNGSVVTVPIEHPLRRAAAS